MVLTSFIFLTPEPSFSPPPFTVLKIHGGDDAHIFLNANMILVWPESLLGNQGGSYIPT